MVTRRRANGRYERKREKRAGRAALFVDTTGLRTPLRSMPNQSHAYSNAITAALDRGLFVPIVADAAPCFLGVSRHGNFACSKCQRLAYSSEG